MPLFENDKLQVKTKSDMSPVSNADILSDKIITSGLKELFPEIPMISEETISQNHSERLISDKCWMLDPIDGTREFVSGVNEFCICLALISDKKPVKGYIFAPATNELWYAVKGSGAWKIDAEGKKHKLPTKNNSDNYLALLSRFHHRPEESKWLENTKTKHKLQTMSQGSALKFCRIAEGSADIYYKIGRIFEWDVAAGQIILEESMGGIIHLDSRKAPEYNKKEPSIGPFLAYGNRIRNPESWLV